MQSRSRFLTGSSIALFAVLFVSVAFAQVGNTGTTDSIQIEAGQVLEIGTDTVSENPDFSWILTRNRIFQSAQRSRFFQTRPAQTGNYMLDVSVQGRNGTQNEYKAFAIVVTEPGSLEEPMVSSGDTLKAKLTTTPAPIDGIVYLPPTGGILVMDGTLSTGRINSYALDLDTTVDTDGDGNPANDRDNEDTYSDKSGSPLLYYMVPKGGERIIQLNVWSGTTGEIDTEELRVQFSDAPTASSSSQTTVIQDSSQIVIEGSDGSARFSANLPESLIIGKELLYEWDFGDRSKSLLTTPTHAYKTSGTFSVSLTVRDITNGQVVFQGANSVTIQTIPQASQSSAVSSAATTEKQPEEEKSSSLGSIFTVAMIILFLLAIAIGMYILFMWIKNKTAGHLSATLENMEKTIVQSAKTAETAVEPLKLKKETPAPVAAVTPKLEDISEREKEKPEFKSLARDNPVPTSSSGPVPSWLAKAATNPTVQSASKPAPTEAAPVPDWLKPSVKKETKSEPGKQTPVIPPVTKEVAKEVSTTAVTATKSAPVVTPPTPSPKPPSVVSVPTKPIAVKSENKNVETPPPKQIQEKPKPVIAVEKAVPAPAPTPQSATVTESTKIAPQNIPEPKPIPKPENNDEPPIAFIKADSLTK